MKQRGFSLMEVLVVISIILFLAALSFPAFARAKESANVRSSLSRLQQFHRAVTIYMIDHEDAPIPYHIPPPDYVFSGKMGLSREFFISPCGWKPNLYVDGQNEFSYVYHHRENTPVAYFQEFRENALLMTDGDCNPPGVFYSPYTIKRGLAVTEGGRLLNHNKGGDTSDVRWWSSPP